MMIPSLHPTVRRATEASALITSQVLQELWSGYGKITRLGLQGGSASSVITKHIKPPDTTNHPRGWNTDRSHQRKLRSYEVEAYFYQHQGRRCHSGCRIPRLLAHTREGAEILLVLEDLDVAGYPLRLTEVTMSELKLCLQWLAEFHATFLADSTEREVDSSDLWETGTYWHLATRPDELAALTDERLVKAAPLIDQALANARYQTLVHGDAKLANFCFGSNSEQVAALDFQYVGAGCGMKDVAYFLGSCLSEEAVAEGERELLQLYFQFLTEALTRRDSAIDCKALVTEWTHLYRYAWVDFHRFLKGWCPTHWKLTAYSERLTQQVLEEVESSFTSHTDVNETQQKKL